jgi:hypothetical protein
MQTTVGHTTISNVLLQLPDVRAVQAIRRKKPASGWGDDDHPEHQGAEKACVRIDGLSAL